MVGDPAYPEKVKDYMGAALRVWQFFHAGIEGTISVLKRAFRLGRCRYRGFLTNKSRRRIRCFYT